MNDLLVGIGLSLIFLPLIMKSKKTGKRTYVEIKEWFVKQRNSREYKH